MAKKIIVADASPLIAFGCIDRLSILTNTLGSIIVPNVVAKECMVDMSRPGALAIQHAVIKKTIKVNSDFDINQDQYSMLLDSLGDGEATAIALALKLNTGLLIDEKLGRRAAKKLEIKVIGTMGVLLLAKQKKHISKIMPVVEELKQSGYYLSAELIAAARKHSKE